MSRWSHCLTEIDEENMTAMCSICGKTNFYYMPNGDLVCSTWRNTDEAERYARSNVRLVIEKMGGKCIFCGFDDWQALQVDHKNGTDGSRHSRHMVHTDILRGRLDPYQLLCANCNAIKASARNERVGCYDQVRLKL